MSLNVFGADGGLEPFEDSAPGDGPEFRMRDHVGKTVVVSVKGTKTVKTKFGEKTGVSAAVKVIEKDGAVDYPDALIFSAAVVQQMTDKAGRTTVATIESYPTDYGNDGYKFAAPTAKQIAEAEAALA